ncbi:MAG: V-type ATPase subunit [Spirochaetaceae bacterium]|jgi:vacuolar-type H+-ATPase subunit C/Vma6|nr:V-type ATPase subunit [Spirochaetaceae bacterium]
MIKPGERAYVYAKACDIIGKSFVGKRIAGLEAVSRLSELDRLIFPKSYRDMPEKDLLLDLERRIMERTADQILRIVNSFSRPPEFLRRLLLSYEYRDLKRVLAALAGREREAPDHTDLGRFTQVRFGAWPDLPAMLRNTEFSFLLEELRGGDLAAALAGRSIALQTKLDIHYYTKLWEALFELPLRDRVESGKILEEEIALRNALWVLRLRTYYQMEGEEARGYLVRIDMRKGGRHYIPPRLLLRQKNRPPGSSLVGIDRATVNTVRRHQRSRHILWQSQKYRSLTEDAEAALELPLDHYEPWQSWSRSGFLNREEPGRHWRLDPRHFQNAASEYLYNLARVSFHHRPFSLDATVCFIKLKQFEEDLLTSMAEGLSLGLRSRDVLDMLEAPS